MNTFHFNRQKYPALFNDETWNMDLVRGFWPADSNSTVTHKYGIETSGDSTAISIWFKDATERDKAFADLTAFTQRNKNTNMNNTVSTVATDAKAFVKEHRQIIYWVVIALLVDHFFLNGKLTDKIRGIIHGILERAEQAITGKKPEPTASVVATTATT